MRITLSWGFGAEISARIAGELFGSSTPRRPHRRAGYLGRLQPVLENEILPQVENIVDEAERLLAF